MEPFYGLIQRSLFLIWFGWCAAVAALLMRRDDDLLISTFLHEQIHWFLVARSRDTDAAVADLELLFPDVPTGYPSGSGDPTGNYIHLIVNFLEYQACKETLGELRARQAMEFWAVDHYTWIYGAVLQHGAATSAILRRHGLELPKREMQ